MSPSAIGLANASGSEFGSLTSINIVQEDDLDSGIGGLRYHHHQIQSQQNKTEEQRFVFFIKFLTS